MLYIKSACGFSRAAIAAKNNLHLDHVKVVNVTEDPSAMQQLEALVGKQQAPCLVIDGTPMLESADIVKTLVTTCTGLWS